MSEHFVSGYCRQIDGSRMVELETDGGEILDIDCCYGSCPFQTSCTIAKSVEEILE